MQIDVARKPVMRLSLTPLIDVVFLLLVFFMLTSTFVRYTALDVSGGRAGAASTELRDLAIIRLHGRGLMDLNAKPVSLGQLEDRLRDLAGERKLRVAVKPGQSASVQEIMELLERLHIDVVRDVVVVR
jgi:biopolymer transport protein ExbD